MMIIWNWCIKYRLHFSQPPPLSVSAVRKGNISHAHTSMLYQTSPVSCYPSQLRSKMCFFTSRMCIGSSKISLDLPIIDNDDDKNIHDDNDGDDVRYHVIEYRMMWENFMACNKALLFFSMKITYRKSCIASHHFVLIIAALHGISSIYC